MRTVATGPIISEARLGFNRKPLPLATRQYKGRRTTRCRGLADSDSGGAPYILCPKQA